jgi:hypothetical protein
MELNRCSVLYVLLFLVLLDSSSLTINAKGSFFRGRYIGTGTTAAPGEDRVAGLSSHAIDSVQMDINADDAQSTTVAAQSFMQAFYPPYALTNTTAPFTDPTSVMANQSYIDFPMGGYQYPVVETLSEYDPQSIYIAGTDNCLNWEISSAQYYKTKEYMDLRSSSSLLYQALGNATSLGLLDISDWTLDHGYWIFDYLTYLNRHNTSVNQILSDTGPFPGALSQVTALANKKEWALFGNTSVSGSTPGDQILTIAGRTLAAKVLGQFFTNLNTLGITNKVTLMVGEFQPMLSLISLLGLGKLNDRFQSIPAYGSAIVFELFTYNTSIDAGINPDPSDLWVRFLYRNGSDVSSSDFAAVNPPIQAYPMFGHGPSQTSMQWSDFAEAMNGIMLNNVEDWCTMCMAPTLYCAAFLDSSSSGGSSNSRKHISPAVGGVIGAIVTLAVLGILAGLFMFFGGLRFYRRENQKLGGFKGSAKLASDTDLSVPNAAPIGISIDDKKGHERVGSWELKGSQKEIGATEPGHQRFTSLGSTIVDRPSYDGDDFGIHSTPVRPRESL